MRIEKGSVNNVALYISVFVCIMAGVLVIPPASQAAFSTLHEFNTGTTDGTFPHGSLTLSGSTLYGTTSEGGSANPSAGTVFKINTDGTGYQVLYNFTNRNDGGGPYGSLTLSGAWLYGTASAGGEYGNGTIFMINMDGTGFQVLHSFTGGSDGADPHGSLTLQGSTLYGMTAAQGAPGLGTIFKIGTDGTGYQVLYSFNTESDGGGPTGSPTLLGSKLYGMTSVGGASFGGTIFQMNTDGTGFQVLHSFSGNDGTNPYGDVTLVGSTLYGMASIGGQGNYGTLFRVNVDGTDYQVLYNFSWSDNTGVTPEGSLTLSGSTLYGMTSGGGVNYGYGTIFQINTDGTGYQVLHTFSGNDGGAPQGSLTLSGSTLYGTTMQYGGGATAAGTIFSMTLAGAPVASFTASPTSGPAPLAVTFTDTSTGSPTGWAWVFADGATSTSQNPKHTYNKAGSYTATLTASNSAGSNPASKTITVNPGGPTVPGAPTIVSVTPGNAEVTVNFTLPSNGGSPITSCTAISNPGNKKANGAGSPIIVKGLTNGKTYTFTVTATNKIGTGPPSTPSNPVTPATKPGAPKNVKAAVGAETGTVIVTFNPPSSNGGSPITSYTVTSAPGSITKTGPSSPITVTGLTSGKKYTFKVAATNGVGTGPTSSPSNSVTPK